MNEIGIRDIESALPAERPEPAAPTLPERAAPARPAQSQAVSSPVSPAAARSRIFAADLPVGDDAWGLSAALRPLAELAVHRDAEAPLTIGFLGGSGSGKSFALGALLGQIEAMTRNSLDSATHLQRIATVRIDATRLEGDVPVSFAGLVYESLGASFPDLAGSAADAVRDPRAAAREIGESLDNARRRLDAEHQSLTEIESRRARIFETVLFESAGSRIDAYARANRTRIESRLESFGFSGDPILNFKSMVRDLAESGGPVARAGAAIRALWAFKGQARLLVIAVLLWLVGIGLGMTVANEAAWLGWLQNSNANLAPTIAWMRAHVDWLSTVQHVAYIGAILALALNVFRASRFIQPLFRGVTLLGSDVTAKRRDLDGLYAHQTRRVDGLASEVERIARQAAAADRRADNHAGRGDMHLEPSPFETGSLKTRAERFFASIGRHLHKSDRGGAAAGDRQKTVPERIVVALDNVDALPPATTYAVLEAAHRIMAQPGHVLLLTLDPARLPDPHGEMARRLEKWIQVPFRVGPEVAALDARGLVAQILGRGRKTEMTAPDATTDWKLSDAEGAMLAALAPIAGTSPRTVKRFVNLYRIVRTQAPEFKTELAFMLAVDLGGTEAERSAIATLSQGIGSGDLDLAACGPRIVGALHEAGVTELKIMAIRRAAAIVRCYSLRGV